MQEQKKQLKVLIIDEHREYFERIRDCAEMCRHQFVIDCQFTASPDQARTIISSWNPGLVLVDAHVPSLNSIEFVRQCSDQKLPVIVTSELPSNDISESARKNGASGYVPKSEDVEEIEALLQQLLSIVTEELPAVSQ